MGGLAELITVEKPWFSSTTRITGPGADEPPVVVPVPPVVPVPVPPVVPVPVPPVVPVPVPPPPDPPQPADQRADKNSNSKKQPENDADCRDILEVTSGARLNVDELAFSSVAQSTRKFIIYESLNGFGSLRRILIGKIDDDETCRKGSAGENGCTVRCIQPHHISRFGHLTSLRGARHKEL